MTNLGLQAVLEALYPQEIVEHLLRAYEAMGNSFRQGRWQSCVLESGPFIEAGQRLLDHQLLESYPPFSLPSPPFDREALDRYAAVSSPEEYRVLIPRVLYAMQAIRRQHGGGRAAVIDPGHIDAHFVLRAAQWVLAELIRLTDASTPAEANALISELLS